MLLLYGSGTWLGSCAVPTSGTEVLVIVLALVPGFVLFFFLRQKIGESHQTDNSVLVIQSLIGSVLVYALIAPLYLRAEQKLAWIPSLTVQGITGIDWKQYGGLLLALIVVPAFVGLTIGWVLTHTRAQSLLSWAKLDVFSRTPTAWDYAFRPGPGKYVIVHLYGGGTVGGTFGTTSGVSLRRSERDLFLQEIWRVNAEGEFVDRPTRNQGIWISGNAIERIEFYR